MKVVITGATGAIGSELIQHFGGIPYDHRYERPDLICDVLINCMGDDYSEVCHKMKPMDIITSINANLISPLMVIGQILPGMRRRDFGRIINISSVLANMGVIGTSAYSAAKAGLNGMIRAIAIENSNHNILINNINLGYMDIGMGSKVPNIDEIVNKIPLKRLCDISEVIKTCEFLINTNYITGTSIDVNGGLW